MRKLCRNKTSFSKHTLFGRCLVLKNVNGYEIPIQNYSKMFVQNHKKCKLNPFFDELSNIDTIYFFKDEIK